ncbi:MAG TPA: hypothetical protein VN446_04650 [Candidatus Acidoferrum sp.]|nr:hypothetical protein [Candidatus Acidoferrum sp.]
MTDAELGRLYAATVAEAGKSPKNDGNTIRVYKETYDAAGNLVHVKEK